MSGSAWRGSVPRQHSAIARAGVETLMPSTSSNGTVFPVLLTTPFIARAPWGSQASPERP